MDLGLGPRPCPHLLGGRVQACSLCPNTPISRFPRVNQGERACHVSHSNTGASLDGGYDFHFPESHFWIIAFQTPWDFCSELEVGRLRMRNRPDPGNARSSGSCLPPTVGPCRLHSPQAQGGPRGTSGMREPGQTLSNEPSPGFWESLFTGFLTNFHSHPTARGFLLLSSHPAQLRTLIFSIKKAKAV